ncbi:probable LRR receptor-like serine/threonine-protein kinase At3g47570 [Telopea speciosissima]|uniref:probable LRR receptor-like serine/threonine-protein kinase At3g47570 n=1 Tax=Telopea speciosissima TaxID=54955 RepID=UPI001CC696DC|nr:probable LRR receptor-like serine/threonine-protein kinase At3g47570 [Telopea speciosissima]
MVSAFASQNLILMAFLQLLVVFILLFGSLLMRLVESVTPSRRMIVGNETDRLALLEFKKQKYDDPYGALSSWNDSIHFCNWVGITCSHRHRQRVISLDLQGKGLGGNISPSIGNLTFLHSLDIGNNTFHGKIPQEISNLIRLQYITLRNNTLQGEIPTSLANCTGLRRIYFSYNNLVGKIPIELFTSLSKLEEIYIFSNGLTGEIPASFGNISSVRVISLGENELQGSIPESFGQLTNLFFLSLHLNNLSGKFPLSLHNLSSLETISLAINHLHGSLPRDIGLTLPNLKFLAIARNLFSGRIPNFISNISTIKLIDLTENSFVGPVPNNLENLQNLQKFSIDGNQCGIGEADDLGFVNSLVNCTNLEILGIAENGFKGPLPNFKANLSTRLSQLILGRNQISGTIPTRIGNLFNLAALGLEGNFLEGNIPSVVGKLQKLQILLLNENRLSGQIPSSIGNLTLLYKLNLQKNSLNGSIPSSIGNCQQLQYLSLFNNSLQGPIPKQLFLISSLSIFLNLSSNSLVGSLPIEIGNLKSLSGIDISKNRLSGEIPYSIGDCNGLESLYMGREVPTKGIFGNASAIFMNGNDKLCGGIAELHLPACTNHGSTKREKSNALKIVLMIIGVAFGFLLMSSFLTLYWIRRSNSKPPSTPLIGERSLNLSYKDLFQTTGGFSSANFIGSGSFGSVYKGIINQDETIVAVKVLNLQNSRLYKSFTAECKALRNIRHRNLVKILTSCSSIDSKGKDFKAFVYEFMPNGSLDDWMHLPVEANNHSRSLTILQRLNIAIDVASALDYLHHNCYAPIVHCDLKPSNVLLNRDMTAHVSDFGLARLLLEPNDKSSQTQTSTIGIKGSIGYAASGYYT